MDLKFAVVCIISVSALLPFTNKLLMLGGGLVVLALLSTTVVTALVGSWFGFILFLIYITGVLVLFGYMLAMSPNVVTDFKWPPVFYVVMGCAVWGFWILRDSSVFSFDFNSFSGYELGVVRIYTGLNLPIYWFMAVVLLVALLMAVAICFKAPKPLRLFLRD